MGSLETNELRSTTIDARSRAQLTIRLIDGPEGAIPLEELGGIAKHLQDAVHRLGRSVSDRSGRGRSGRGRSPKLLRDLTRLEAVAIRPGSAVLEVIAPGAQEELPLDHPEVDMVIGALDLLREALEATGRGHDLPTEVDDLARGSMQKLFESIQSYQKVEFSYQGIHTGQTSLVPAVAAQRLSRRSSARRLEAVTVTGELYQVNLHTHGYTIEDDLGRSIPCEFTDDAQHIDIIRRLVGRLITAVGTGEYDESGELVKLSVDRIEAARTIDTAQEYVDFDLESTIALAQPIEDIDSLRIEGLTGDEADAFWTAISE